MNLTRIIFNVAKVLSIVAFTSIPTFAVAQSNISYNDFDSDEIAIITNGNNSEHIFKEENAAIHNKLIKTVEVITDFEKQLTPKNLENLGYTKINKEKDSHGEN